MPLLLILGLSFPLGSASHEQLTHQNASDKASPPTNAFKSNWSYSSPSSEQPSCSGINSTSFAAANSSQLVIPSSHSVSQQAQLLTDFHVSTIFEELSQSQVTNQFENMPTHPAETSKSIVKVEPLSGSVQRHSTDTHQASLTEISFQDTTDSVGDTQLPTLAGLDAAMAPFVATYQPATTSLANQVLQHPLQMAASFGDSLDTQNNIPPTVVSYNDATAYSSSQLMQSSFSAFHPFTPVHQIPSFTDSHQAASTNSTLSSFLQSTSDSLHSEILYTNSIPQTVNAESVDSATTSAGEKRNVPIDLSNPTQDGILSKRTKLEGKQ